MPDLYKFSVLTCLSFWTNAWKRSHSINASRSISTGSSEAIINVLTAVVPTPTIDTDTGIATIVVGAGTSILTSVGLELTFINIFSAKLAWCIERNTFNKSSDTRTQEDSCTENITQGNAIVQLDCHLLFLGHSSLRTSNNTVIKLGKRQLASIHDPNAGAELQITWKGTVWEPAGSLQYMKIHLWGREKQKE